MAVLPPGVSAEAFAAATRAFAAAAGDEWVFTSDDELIPYRDYWSPVPDPEEALLPSAAVAPASVEEVQAIVRAANEHRTPLFPISTGKNFAYGGPAPSMRGCVVVDLKRMNRVLEVSDERNFALVEPGVSYFDLYEHIQQRGLNVWIDCANPGWGGPLGNTLDRGMGFTLGYYRDHAGAMHGVEVVLANGEVMRTGMGAVPDSRTWQDYRYAFGPDPSGLFPQGNFGIVTKMGVRLMPAPEHYRTGLVTVPKRADLRPLIAAVNYLSDLFMIGEPLYGSPLGRLWGDAEFREAATRRGGANAEEMDRLAAAAGLHSWQVELQFLGSEGTTLANWDYAKSLIARRVPDARFTDIQSVPLPLTEEQIALGTIPDQHYLWRSNLGIPSLNTWQSLGRSESMPDAWRQNHVGMFAVIPRSADGVFEAQQVFGDTLRDMGVGTRISAISTPVNWYQFSFLFSAGFSSGGGRPESTPETRARDAEILKTLMKTAAEHGWAEYRAAPWFQDAVSDAYSFNNHALRRFNETLKDAVDPNGILAPGRGGIWPRHLRGNRG
ncbi:MAG: FAD-binding oxidoreductase [Gammaproteobacteria bacterium]|nr:FAD-binding oxidoreductase [Gammaproteobacteria bacterium]